jgi:hypothetical protein
VKNYGQIDISEIKDMVLDFEGKFVIFCTGDSKVKKYSLGEERVMKVYDEVTREYFFFLGLIWVVCWEGLIGC